MSDAIRLVHAHQLSKLHVAVLCDASAPLLRERTCAESLNARDAEGSTPLHLAVILGRRNAVEWMLSHERAPVQAQDGAGNTPLHVAVARENVEIARLLLARSRAALWARDARGRTALHLAVANHEADTLRLLLRHGADPHAGDDRGNTALHYACTTDKIPFIALLAEHTNVNAQNAEGLTPLTVAVESQHLGVVRVLLQSHRIDPNARTHKTLTPLHVAVRHDRVDIVEELLAHPNIRPNERACDDYTPLHVACVWDRAGTLRTLLRHPWADVDAETGHGSSTLSLAIAHEADGCIVELLLHGADCADLDAAERERADRALEAEIARLMDATADKRRLRRQVTRLSMGMGLDGRHKCGCRETQTRLERVRWLRQLEAARDVTTSMQDVLVHAVALARAPMQVLQR